MTKDIEPHRISNPDLKSAHWTCQGLYLSDICLLAHLQARSVAVAKGGQEELRVFLRWLGQAAMEHDIWRPVVAVLEIGNGTNPKDAPWLQDQEWHRGDFLVFSLGPKESPEDRIHDLLSGGKGLPKWNLSSHTPHDDAWFRGDLTNWVKAAPPSRADHLQGILDAIFPTDSKPADEEGIHSAMLGWSRRRIDEAEARLQGGQAG